jgi:hypothetical protein
LWRVDNKTGNVTPFGKGHSGAGKGTNDPTNTTLNVGPLPSGTWKINPNARGTSDFPRLDLIPGTNVNMGKRTGDFQIHPDIGPGSSTGCIAIGDADLINRISAEVQNTGDDTLEVIGGVTRSEMANY